MIRLNIINKICSIIKLYACKILKKNNIFLLEYKIIYHIYVLKLNSYLFFLVLLNIDSLGQCLNHDYKNIQGHRSASLMFKEFAGINYGEPPMKWFAVLCYIHTRICIHL